MEELIAALWPSHVFPYELWEKAYLSCWKNAAVHNAIFHLAGNPPELPVIPANEYEITGLYYYKSQIAKFFESLAIKLFAAELKSGFHYIIDEIYDGNIDELKGDTENIEYGFRKLSLTEEAYDITVSQPYIWAENITSERFRELAASKILAVPSSFYSFIRSARIDREAGHALSSAGTIVSL